MEFNLRYYVFLIHSYITYLKMPDKELINSWDNNIKPFITKKYSFEQSGIFNVNADIKYFMKEIDNAIKKSKIITINNNLSEKKEIKKIQSNDNLNTFSSLSDKMAKLDQEQDEFENDLEIIKIEDEEELINNKNIINIENSDKNDDNDDNNIKRAVSLNEIKCHSSTIASKSTAVSIYDELNNKSNEIRISCMSYSQTITSTKSIKKEISPNFSDEFETEGVNIVHRKNIIIQMTYNLFLKKIVVGKFFDDYFYNTINFTEQCFYFMKKDIIFKKIMNCYKYYTNLKVPFIQRKNIIHFMNILVIKMHECFTILDPKEDILIKIKKFYNDLINELKSFLIKTKKRNSKIGEFLLGGINAIKTGVNTIKENIDKKIKSINDKEDKNEIKKEEKIHNIKENLNIVLIERQQKKEEKTKININEKEEDKKEEINNKEKEKEKEKNEKEKIPEEEVLFECEKILSLLQNEVPKQETLNQTEQILYFYKLKLNYLNNKKNNNSKKFVRTLKKSNTERYLSLSLNEQIKDKETNNKKPYFSFLNYEIKEIGEELIYISKSSLNAIKRKELYNGAFLKKSKSITSPNIIENINKFNKLIFFIIEDILSYDFPKDRAKSIENWANVADYCKKRRDYNDIFAINSAFKNYIISGLNLTWKEIGSKAKRIIKDLENICSFEGNYKNVREDMKSLANNDFYIPYLGLLLKDLNFYEESYKYIVNGNFINFEKINEVQNAIDEFFHYQKIKDKKKINLNQDLDFFECLENQKEEYLENLASKLEPKFILYMNPKKIKRLTYIDKKYFKGHSGKGLLNISMRQSHV